MYLQKFISCNFFISKGIINFFRINLTFTKYITTGVESCGAKSCGVESILPMPLSILYTKSLI